VILKVTAKVPDEWRDSTQKSGLLAAVYLDIETALRLEGIEDVEITTHKTICGHENWKGTGHCAYMECDNYVSKHMH
jgi:hypothetical protein